MKPFAQARVSWKKVMLMRTVWAGGCILPSLPPHHSLSLDFGNAVGLPRPGSHCLRGSVLGLWQVGLSLRSLGEAGLALIRFSVTPTRLLSLALADQLALLWVCSQSYISLFISAGLEEKR